MKKYEFDSELYYKKLEELYPTTTRLLGNTIDYNCFTEENLNKIMDVTKEIIDNPIIKEVEIEDTKENINIFNERTNETINEIFHDDELVFFGHGGRAKEIIDTEFKCRFSNLSSHFVPLDCTNESLELFKKWPHRNAKQIAVLALNKYEYNPIYKELETNSNYDENKYSISSDYFVGYYDSEKNEFIKNPNFKKRHDFDPECTIYQDESLQMSMTSIDGPEIINDFYNKLQLISRIMFFSSIKSMLDDIGYKKVCQKILYELKNLKELQNKITPEYLQELIDEYNKSKNSDNEYDNNISDDWIDDWGDDWGEEISSSPKKNVGI